MQSKQIILVLRERQREPGKSSEEEPGELPDVPTVAAASRDSQARPRLPQTDSSNVNSHTHPFPVPEKTTPFPKGSPDGPFFRMDPPPNPLSNHLSSLRGVSRKTKMMAGQGEQILKFETRDPWHHPGLHPPGERPGFTTNTAGKDGSSLALHRHHAGRGKGGKGWEREEQSHVRCRETFRAPSPPSSPSTRGGVKRILGSSTRRPGCPKGFLGKVIRDAVTYTQHAQRKTVHGLDGCMPRSAPRTP
ncbi:Histone H4 [Chionoecetes opilio]|uniref:Histone H4 n=1 Tax=Chionoecetes opilio TaxID=41210 RepID=A0A8J4YG17_CHIOP|nr:Histone H4 [Chionoecetes opilio]